MKKKLVVPNSEPLQFHTTMTELLSVIREEHTSCGYGGEKRTLRKAAKKKKKKQISLEIKWDCMFAQCEICQLKKARMNKDGGVANHFEAFLYQRPSWLHWSAEPAQQWLQVRELSFTPSSLPLCAYEFGGGGGSRDREGGCIGELVHVFMSCIIALCSRQ